MKIATKPRRFSRPAPTGRVRALRAAFRGAGSARCPAQKSGGAAEGTPLRLLRLHDVRQWRQMTSEG